MSVYLQEAARSLLSHKQRTLLALIGIVIGIGSVISLVQIGQIVTYEASKQFMSLGTDIVSVKVTDTSGGGAVDKDVELFQALAPELSCLSSAAVFTHQSDAVPWGNGYTSQVDLFGTQENFQHVAKLNMQAGRFVSNLDQDRLFVAIGSKLGEVFGLPADPNEQLGQEVDYKGLKYTVVGVIEPSPRISQINADVDYCVFAPIKADLENSAYSKIEGAIGRMRDQTQASQCVHDIEQYFLKRNPVLSVRVTTAEQLIKQMRKQAEMLSALLAAIGAISLIVGGVGIMNIMLVSVSERRQEIGIRRALGAQQKDIRAQFLVEAILLSLVGGIVGVASGITSAYVVSSYQGWEFFITWTTPLLGAGVSTVIGVFFGFFPAHQAARLDPISALRSD